MSGIKVYNLYLKLIGSMGKWVEHFDRIKAMNFEWIYVNPITYPGFSGSDYSVKDYYLYHPLFVTGEYDFNDPESQRERGNELLQMVCTEAEKRGLKLMIDLVINHTAIDCPLVSAKPEWYIKDKNGNIKNPGAYHNGKWVEWADLAEIDNENSSDRDELWNYWLELILHYCRLGIRGFRADAAYHVTKDLWKYLIENVKKYYPDVIFLGETLGCSVEALREVGRSGFDYIMNSLTWWDFKQEWFLKDYNKWAGEFQSLTFPENHDTERYAKEIRGNRAMAISKYAFGAYFCSSIAITVGFEYGFTRKIDVVQTNPSWWEDKKYDLTYEISRINEIKSKYKILQEDNVVYPYELRNKNLFAFSKESRDGSEKIFVIINKSETAFEFAYVNGFYEIMGGLEIQDISHGHRMDFVPDFLEYGLKPGEVKLFYIKR
jgi:glycosidase